MKLKLPLFCLILFFESFSSAQIYCQSLIDPIEENKEFVTALKKGLELFEQGQNPFEIFQGVYVQGSSTHNIQRSTGAYFLGNKVQSYPRLSELFSSLYDGHIATYTYHHGTKPINQRSIRFIKLYSQFAAQKYFLLQELGIPELYESPYLEEFMDLPFISSPEELKNFLTSIIAYGPDLQLRNLIPRLTSATDFDTLFQSMQLRRGVVIIIDDRIKDTYPVERDPEFDDGARVIISPFGVPWKFVKALIPQSRADYDDLIKLLNDQRL